MYTEPRCDDPTPARGTERVTVIGPGDVLAALPYVLGFHPCDSLIAVGVSPLPTPTLRVAARMDLPAATGSVEPMAGVDRLAARFHRERCEVILVVVTSRAASGVVPHRAWIQRCRAGFTDAGVRTRMCLWAENTRQGGAWCSYDYPDEHGVVPDAGHTGLPVVAALHGLVTRSSRAALRTLIQPDPAAALARRAQQISTALASDSAAPSPAATYRRLQQVRDAIRRAAHGRLPTSDAEIVELGVALGDHAVRDICVSRRAAALDDAAANLWQRLTCALPAPHRVEAAVLMAAYALQAGDGAMATVALDAAHEADPHHRFAGLLRSAASAFSPQQLHAVLLLAATDTENSLLRALAG